MFDPCFPELIIKMVVHCKAAVWTSFMAGSIAIQDLGALQVFRCEQQVGEVTYSRCCWPILEVTPAHVIKVVWFVALCACVSKGGADPFTLGAESRVAVAFFATTPADNTIVMLEAVSSSFIICCFRGGATTSVGAV